MIDLQMEVDDLLKWSRYMTMVRKATPKAIADGLNAAGDNIARNYAHFVSEKTDMDEDEVLQSLVIDRAEPGSLEYRINASKIFPPSGDWSRPWDMGEAKSTGEFAPEMLVKVITAGDGVVCKICQDLADNGPWTWLELSTKFYEGGNWGLFHPHAVLSGTTFASYGRVKEMVAAKFSGPAINIVTARGGDFPIGPHHPILTRRGFVTAGRLRKGDELLYDTRIEGAVGVIDGDSPDIPLVETAFHALKSVGMSSSAAASPYDLHGDAVFCERKVDVVVPTRSLLPEFDPSGIEQFSDLVAPMRAGSFQLNALVLAASRLLANAKALGKRQDTLAGVVKRSHGIFRWDRVLGVHRIAFLGGAYDATTSSALYLNNGYVVHNCRCQTQQWQSTRALPVTWGQGSAAPPELLNMRQIGERVAGEIEIVLKTTAGSD